MVLGRAWDYVAKWSRGVVSQAGGSGVIDWWERCRRLAGVVLQAGRSSVAA